MIIIPKYKFVFFKPMKIAGSSIEKGLINFCDNKSLCTGGSSLPKVPGKMYTQKEIFESVEYNQINNVFLNNEKKFEVRFHSHTDPAMFFSKIKNKDIYKDFKYFSAVRNPWDTTVSFYWWNMHLDTGSWPDSFKIKKKDSRKIARKKFSKWLTSKASFNSHNSSGEIISSTPAEWISKINCGFIDDRIHDYIHYEKGLNEEYRRIFQPIIIDEWLTELPKLKTSVKKIKRHYSFYYDNKSIQLVSDLNQKTIKKFGYMYKKDLN